MLYPVEGGEPRPTPGLETGARRWSGDGRYIFLRQGVGLPARLYRLEPAAGRKARAGYCGSTAARPGGGQVLLSTYWRALSDLFLVSGLK